MSITNVWMLGPVVTAGGQINQIQDYTPDLGIETILHTGDGSVEQQFAAVMMQSPKLGFTSTALNRVLTLVGQNGYAIAAAAQMWFQKVAAGGTRSGSTTSMKIAGTKGIVVIKSIEAEDKQPAKVTLEMVLVSTDGIVSPITYTTAVAMPSVTAVDQLFVNGPVSINGATLEGIKSTKVDFGLDLVVENGSGEAYPTFVGIKRRKAQITFKTTDVTFNNASAGVIAQDPANPSAIYFRAVAQGGTRVANATTSHIKIVVNAGLITVKQTGGGGEDTVQMAEVTIDPTYDGTNNTLAITAGAAIT